MNYMKKKALLLGLLTNLTALSLTGCENKIANTNIEIVWENDTITSGIVPYDDICGNMKVVILEQNGTIKPFFMIKELIRKGGTGSTTLSYIDVKTGIKMVQYYWSSSHADIETKVPDSVPIGKSITILEEQEFYDYLFEFGEIRSEFDISELIDVYNNEIEPQLVKYIDEKYSNHKK